MCAQAHHLQTAAIGLATHLAIPHFPLREAAESASDLLTAFPQQPTDLAALSRYFQTDMSPSLHAVREGRAIHDAERASVGLLALDLSEAFEDGNRTAPNAD